MLLVEVCPMCHPILAVAALLAGSALAVAEETPAERGKKALLTRSYNPPTMALTAYDNAWKHWGLEKKPDRTEYDRLFRERYGLHPAPYPNNDLPMGVRVADFRVGGGKGL